MADSKLGAEKAENKPEISCIRITRKVLEKNGNMSKGQRSQSEAAATSHIWDNLSTKINNDSNGLNQLSKIGIHEFLQRGRKGGRRR